MWLPELEKRHVCRKAWAWKRWQLAAWTVHAGRYGDLMCVPHTRATGVQVETRASVPRAPPVKARPWGSPPGLGSHAPHPAPLSRKRPRLHDQDFTGQARGA